MFDLQARALLLAGRNLETSPNGFAILHATENGVAETTLHIGRKQEPIGGLKSILEDIIMSIGIFQDIR